MRVTSWVLASVLLAGCRPGAGDPCDFAKQNCGGDLLCVKPPDASAEEARCTSQAQADELCTKLPLCRVTGACSYTVKGTGICVPRSDADCQKSDVCTQQGRCTLDKSLCIVGKDEDCRMSELCKKHGKCKAKPSKRLGQCVEQ